MGQMHQNSTQIPAPWAHMAFVFSILISKDAMYTVTRFFEGEYFFARPYPALVSFIVALVLLIFIAHAALALRKFPASYQQYRIFLTHRKRLQHSAPGVGATRSSSSVSVR